MGKRKCKTLVSPLSIYFPHFSLYKENKDGTSIFRCKFCFKSRIKKENNLLYRLSGHSPKCPVINKKDKIGGVPNITILNSHSKYKEGKTVFLRRKNINNKKLPKIDKNKNGKIIISKPSSIRENEDYIIYENFIVNKKKILGEGSFITTYLGYDSKNNEEVAIKFCKEKAKLTCALDEIVILEQANEVEGFPRFKGAFKYKKNDVIIETLLGPSLDKIIKFYKDPFTLETICLIGIEIIKRLQSLHKLGILHNDLKPSNFSWGIFKNGEIINKNEIFLIDFGLASRYKLLIDNENEKKGVNSKKIFDDKTLIINRVSGNLKFMSLDLLKGNNSSPKSEMESFIYILIYLFKYKLPWTKIKAKTHLDKRNKILEVHKTTTGKELCKGLPYQISYIYNEIISLNSNEEPDYQLYIKVLNDLLFLVNLNKNKEFCWEEKILYYKKNNFENKKEEYLFL